MKNEMKLTMMIPVGITVILGLINWRYATGFVMGSVMSVLLYMKTTWQCNRIVAGAKGVRFGFFLSFLLSYVLMAFPLLTAVLLPQYFNVFAAAAGLFLVKLILIVQSFLERRKKDG